MKWDKIIDEQLRLQVRISYDRHQKFMRQNNLLNCENVIDLGTGNGYFLTKLASDYKHIDFCGIDKEPDNIFMAQKNKVSNVRWSVGDITRIETLPDLSLFDGIIMRYSILHIPRFEDVLRKISAPISSNTLLWIFDLDLDYFKCEPPHSGFDIIKNLVSDFSKCHSRNTLTDKKLPKLLKQADLELIEKEVEPYSNKSIDVRLFSKFLTNEALLYNRDLGADFDSPAMKKVKKFINDEVKTKKSFAQYGMVMICAKKN